MRRRNLVLEKETDGSFEIDLAPMLSLIVTLIPIMLLSTAFVKVTVIESPLPQVIKAAIEDDKKNREEKVKVQLVMTKSKEFKVISTHKGKTLSNDKISAHNNGSWNFDGLHQNLLRLKRLNPKIFHIDITPSAEVAYVDIVKAMDEARSIKNGELEFEIDDPKTNKKTNTKLMFPDVVFANVVEG